jgi:glycosyltransferase involved in cell wall biosynthesis
VADARLHREVAALLRAGLAVEVLGLGDPSAAPPGVAVRTWSRGSIGARGFRALALPFRARGRVLITLDPDVVPTALLATRLRRRRLVADVHEDYVALLVDRSWAGPARGVFQRLAGWCIAASGRADLTTVADEHVPPAAAGCRQRLVVRNLPDPELLPPLAAVPDVPPLRALYIGDVRTSRGLRAMIEAIGAAPGWSLDVVGPVAGDDADWLHARLLGADVEGRVRMHGRRPPREAWAIGAGASVGMLLAEQTPAFRDAVPTKLYEYLATGMAVLCTPLPRVVPFVRDERTGAVVEDAAAAAEQLNAWAVDPRALRAVRLSAAAYAAAELRQASPWDELASAVQDLLPRPSKR